MYLGDGGGKKKHEELKDLLEPLTKLMKEVLGDKDEKVIVRRRIVDSLCVLTTSEYGWFANMERIMKARALRDNSVTSHMASERTMEVNPTHFITKELEKKASADKSDKTVKDLKLLLFDFSPVFRLQLGRANTVCGTHSPHDQARTEHRR